ncbi:MAG: response regulator transcription factor [Puniceicoccaceae bacterium]
MAVLRAGHVYLLDDDRSVRNGFSRLLRAAGYQVESYHSSDDLLDQVDHTSVGCLVMDLRMPGKTAEAIRSELDKRGAQLSIIIVTGDDSEETRIIAQKAGAAGFFRKPVDGSALLDAIKWNLNAGPPS